MPDKVALKDPKDFKLIGQKLPRVDIPGKTNGTAQFTIDVTFPNMLVAVLQRPPLFGATVKSFDPTATKAVPGVVEVLQVPRGVAVVAKSFWAAKLGRDALKVEWDDSKAEKRSTAAIMAEYRRLAEQPGKPARKEGDAAAALKGAAKLITATYEFPYLAHAPMEPLDAVVKLDADSCEIWCGDQFQTVDQANAAATAGLKPEQVKIHTLLAGGSFGRRANMGSDYIVEAVSVAKALGANGTPVKLQWTREDDIRGGLYRPIYLHRLEAALDENGQLVGWQHRIVGQSIIAGTAFAAVMVKDGIDGTSVEGAANLPYAVPNMSVELNTTETGVPVLWWRVVGSSHTAYATEAFIDEIAHAAGKDPFAFRQAMLEHHPRHKAVLELAAEGGRLGQPVAERQGPRHRRRRGVRHLRRAGRRSDGGAERQGQGGPRRLRCRLRHADQSGRDRGADGRRHRLRPGRGALRRDHAEGRQGRAEQISTATRCCASTRCRRSRCISCRRPKRRPASANRASRRSGRPSPTRSSPPPANGCAFFRSRSAVRFRTTQSRARRSARSR